MFRNEDQMTSFNRREFLIRSGLVGGAALSGPAFLAACGSSGNKTAATTTTVAGEVTKPTVAPIAGGADTVRMANWVLYIGDDEQPNNTPTLKSFTDSTKLKVAYRTAVDGNDEFTEVNRGNLEKKADIGYDIVVVTSWMASRWIANGWVQDLPEASIPNRTNVLDRLANPGWDPGRKKSLPYAIGQVGIAYYPDKVGFEITSVKQLLDTKLKGRVSLLSEMRDTTGLFMMAEGRDPSKADIEGTKAAIATIKKARDAGQFRAIKGNSYVEDLDLGDVWAAVAWSGDIASLQATRPELKWILPSDGAMSFTDTMLIPAGAKNVEGAGKLINHFYDPAISGPLFESIQYVSPVKGAGEKMSAKAAGNPILNPPTSAKIVEFADLTEEQAAELSTAFDEATKL
jgi:spermidine/putrescine transport system substrate-binding protein